MSDKCGNCDCADKSQCVKKGTSYGVVIVEAEKSHLKEVAAGEVMGGLSMDQAFVQAPEHRAKPSVAEADGIPVIDLSPLFAADGVDVDALAAEVGRASQDWGFFVVVRHGVPEEVVARAAEAQRAFFALPPARRAAVARSEAAQMGYYASDHTQNVRDWKEAFDLVPTRHPPPPPPAGVLDNKWPDDLPGFRSFGSLTSSSSSRRLVPHQILEQRSNGGVRRSGGGAGVQAAGADREEPRPETRPPPWLLRGPPDHLHPPQPLTSLPEPRPRPRPRPPQGRRRAHRPLPGRRRRPRRPPPMRRRVGARQAYPSVLHH
ncbi:putative inactive flavonol synthase 2 isoform X1 [Oryza sativa Japonica Group]|uniref:putative inactive flavonol synthase 2 isoform X1 n=1 Tax=Oryza sativa subsp. japonica TaxID=39947 RepID=UPI0007755D2A